MQLSLGHAHDLEGADVLLEALLDQIEAPCGQSLHCKDKTPGSLRTAPGGSSNSTEVQSKGTLGV